MKPIVIIKTGDSIASLVARRGDFEDWILAGMGEDLSEAVLIVAVNRGEGLPRPGEAGGVIITGSHAMVTDRADWSERTADWLRGAVEKEIPVLGICYGHQLLAHALGGGVGYLPGGPEFGTVTASLTKEAAGDPLFRGFLGTMDVQTSHYQAVTELPPRAVLLGRTVKDPHSAFRFGPCAWGVQFHPEYDADITNAYIKEENGNRKKSPGGGGLLSCDARETTAGRLILRRFAAFAAGRGGASARISSP